MSYQQSRQRMEEREVYASDEEEGGGGGGDEYYDEGEYDEEFQEPINKRRQNPTRNNQATGQKNRKTAPGFNPESSTVDNFTKVDRNKESEVVFDTVVFSLNCRFTPRDLLKNQNIETTVSTLPNKLETRADKKTGKQQYSSASSRSLVKNEGKLYFSTRNGLTVIEQSNKEDNMEARERGSKPEYYRDIIKSVKGQHFSTNFKGPLLIGLVTIPNFRKEKGYGNSEFYNKFFLPGEINPNPQEIMLLERKIMNNTFAFNNRYPAINPDAILSDCVVNKDTYHVPLSSPIIMYHNILKKEKPDEILKKASPGLEKQGMCLIKEESAIEAINKTVFEIKSKISNGDANLQLVFETPPSKINKMKHDSFLNGEESGHEFKNFADESLARMHGFKNYSEFLDTEFFFMGKFYVTYHRKTDKVQLLAL